MPRGAYGGRFPAGRQVLIFVNSQPNGATD